MQGNHSDAQLHSSATHAGSRWSSAGWTLLAATQAAFLMYVLGWPTDFRGLGLPLGLISAFAFCAYVMRGVSVGGALVGWLTAACFYVVAGLNGLILILIVFLLTVLTSRLGSARKATLNLSDGRARRTASQVLANLWIASMFALLTFWSRKLFAASLAALACAAADTVASEIGEAYATGARLLTTLAKVPAGTDGGLSGIGTLAGGLAGCAVVADGGVIVGMVTVRDIAMLGVCGVAGMFFDSLLGATLQRRGHLSNSLVNLASTAFSAGLAILILPLL